MRFTDILVALSCWTVISVVFALSVGGVLGQTSTQEDLVMAPSGGSFSED